MNDSQTETQSDSGESTSSANQDYRSKGQWQLRKSKAGWANSLISGLTVIGVAGAAAYASTNSEDKAIGITAWVAVAVVGASTMISTMKNNKQ